MNIIIWCDISKFT